MSPDKIAAALAWDLVHHWQFQGLTAFTLEGGNMRSIPNTWWQSFPKRALQALQDRIESTQISHETGYQEWRQQSLLALPAGVFVWRDEYEPMYYRTVGLSSRIFNLDTGDGVPDLGLLPYAQLQFDPFIPDVLTRQLVMEGFSLQSRATGGEEEEEEEIFDEDETTVSTPPTAKPSVRESPAALNRRRYQMCIDAKMELPDNDYATLPRGINVLAKREGITTQAFSKSVKKHIVAIKK
jgi:hypothetical protein